MASGSPKVQLLGSRGYQMAGRRGDLCSPSTGREVGAVRCAAQGRAGVTLTGLMAHAAEDGPHLHPEVSLSLLQALVH